MIWINGMIIFKAIQEKIFWNNPILRKKFKEFIDEKFKFIASHSWTFESFNSFRPGFH